jgi:hypothetical protein
VGAQCSPRGRVAGFVTASHLFSTLPAPLRAQLAADVLHAAVGKGAAVSASESVRTALNVHSHVVSQDDMQSALNALHFVFRTALSSALDAEALARALHSASDFSAEAREQIVKVWASEAAGRKPQTHDAPKLGQLVGIDWKLGVGVASSHCAALRAPFVSLRLRIADAQGHVSHQAVEVSLREFRDLLRSFQQMATQLDSS